MELVGSEELLQFCDFHFSSASKDSHKFFGTVFFLSGSNLLAQFFDVDASVGEGGLEEGHL